VQGRVPKLRTDDLQQKLAKMRESDSILVESADARANPR
jgi:hypothetical protein